MPEPTTADAVRRIVAREVAEARVVDMHTHLYDARFGGLLLWGVDELLTYHYLVAELFRARPDLTYEGFWKLPKRVQADLVWGELFVKRSPVSEACRGVVTCLAALAIRPGPEALERARAYFKTAEIGAYTDRVFKLAGVERVVMTNDPFDDAERAVWLSKDRGEPDPRFLPALRIDSLLVDWPGAAKKLRAMKCKIKGGAAGPDAAGVKAVRKFLADWADRMRPVYLAASLPPDFDYPGKGAGAKVLRECVLPFAEERKFPVALMIGVRKLVNPELRLAGDSLGLARVEAVEALSREWPGVCFFVTMLARENQHALCVAARKFKNLMPFGCWWFLNDPSIIREMTAERLELLGLSFVPQHSDARVLDQLVYTWRHARAVGAEVLGAKYADLAAAGWPVETADIRRDVARLLSGNFLEFARA